MPPAPWYVAGPLFGLLVVGLRAAEPCGIFVEHLGNGWLRVPCIPELGLMTKGRRDKRFPLLEELQPLWGLLRRDRSQGLLFVRRPVFGNAESPPLANLTLNELVAEYRRRHSAEKKDDAKTRYAIRDSVLQQAGGYHIVYGVLAAAGAILSAGYILWMMQRVYLGQERPEQAAFADATRRELLILVPLAALCILLGVLPKQFVLDYVSGTLAQILALAPG